MPNSLAELSKKATIKVEKTEKQEVAASKSPKKTEQQDAVKSKNALAAKKEATVKDCGHWVALKRAALDRVRRRLRPKPGDDLVLSDSDFEISFTRTPLLGRFGCTTTKAELPPPPPAPLGHSRCLSLRHHCRG